jgi:hypothetical protein
MILGLNEFKGKSNCIVELLRILYTIQNKKGEDVRKLKSSWLFNVGVINFFLIVGG